MGPLLFLVLSFINMWNLQLAESNEENLTAFLKRFINETTLKTTTFIIQQYLNNKQNLSAHKGLYLEL